MASRNKKTTMAKLTRESKLRERRLDKAARKEARRSAAEAPEEAILDPESELESDADAEVPAHDSPAPLPS